MAEVQKAKPPASQPAAKGKDPKGAGKIPTAIPEIRNELAKARRDHAIQALESPVRLRALRQALAKALTKERAEATAKEARDG